MRVPNRTTWAVGMVVTAVLLVGGCAKVEKMEGRMGAAADSSMLTLSGSQEVPPVTTQASGRSSIAVIGDKVVTGRVEVSNMSATAAHIHQGASGQNGPVIITLVKTADNVWSAPPNAQLTSAQFDAYRAGQLYINVHSAANPAGEIRAQIKP